ncbi:MULTISPECIES: M20 metallopeptidase family protein [Lysinibacillus]|uniref:Amidohydrolase n=2 Tax=Lysinibacillus TaxID=400634 RepID=A0ABY2TC23_9BACI|nr:MULTISPECIES: amidohydrolase [Lysinibacillus]AHN23806.1 N-acyl-L-amino acid amidohydrolase [Lysinibacillus varians]TKI45448.1 amidohydrolase [Lysinibacillus tabacifolii]TKI65733.1 amidohydrolase [Lysinibacillus varians]
MIKTKDLHQQVIAWRQHLHMYPELSHQEHQTAQFIYEQLITFPHLEVKRLTETSVYACLKGTKTEGQGHTILLRADIDALPIEEETDLPFKSKNPGVMHACGHDAHPAMLLGAAKVLAERGTDFNGEIRFIFQHAEEVTPGGAAQLVSLGVADNVDYAFALHVSPDYQVGQFAMKDGKFTAAADDFEIKIYGRGGHASTPEVAIDPLLIGSEMVVALQTIVSRKVPSIHAPVLTVAKFHCGTALNIIADTAELGGTIRSLDATVRVEARHHLEKIVNGIASMHGARVDIKWELGCPSVTNDKELTALSRQIAGDIVGAEGVQELPAPMFGTEDFADFSEIVPSSMQYIGVHNEDFGEAYPLHHPRFKIDEDALIYGVRYFEKIARTLCP